MSDAAASTPRAAPAALFALTAFMSAALVFMVEPMVARLVLPILGGSAAVWNSSLAFFQAALLAGYVYAHLLQRLPSLRAQTLVHAVVLALGALSLPLRVSGLLGDPNPDAPAAWLVGTLALSVGAPFAALSATAPLIQAWHARAHPGQGEGGPWGLYAASNLGSLLALVAYPAIVEPVFSLGRQTQVWSWAYGLFALLILAVAASLGRVARARRDGLDARLASVEPVAAVTWLDRLRWVLLAAAPSSLMLGVTSYVTTDVGSAPFLWVAPLALYLLTFIIAFQDRPAISSKTALFVQAGAVLVACALVRPMPRAFLAGLTVHFTSFFFTALVCHQALVARRPPREHLTDFYISMALGGVVGGAFNAFLAPAIFHSVIEYPAVLALAGLARRWAWRKPIGAARWAALGAVALLIGMAVLVAHPMGRTLISWVIALGSEKQQAIVVALVGLAATIGFFLRDRAWLLVAACLLIAFGGGRAGDGVDVIRSWRGFFGVLRESRVDIPGLGGEVRLLSHGTTLHGAQALAPGFRCRPLLYYAHETPIGQVFDAEHAAKGRLVVGAVGLGTGTVAAYDRPGDAFTFFEIDPLVKAVSTDPANFGYLTGCAKGALSYRLGDARLTLGREPAGRFDVLLIDAFSSDSVPAHLLTVEAARLYLARIRPEGVIVLHLSNRNLDLLGPAQAVALAAGAKALVQSHWADPALPDMWESSEDALIMARDGAALAPFLVDPRWRPATAGGVRPWTDDYTNLFGALVRRLTTAPARPPTPVRGAGPPPPPPARPGPPRGR